MSRERRWKRQIGALAAPRRALAVAVALRFLQHP
jgi:hypothetical protein